MRTIIVDFDNVLNNLTEKAIELLNSNSDKDIQISDITSYNFYDCLDKEDADKVVKSFKNKSLWDSLTPIEGSREGLQKLVDDGHKVYIATATAPENFQWKMSFLKKYFPFFNTDNVIRIMDKSLLRADILIEDSMEQLVKHKLCHRVCLDYPWNHDESKDFIYSIHRCQDWSQILNEINKIEEEIKSYE